LGKFTSYELLPPKEKLLYATLPKVVGCKKLEEQIRTIGSRCHIYGHTHIDGDVIIDDVRYVQNAFGYPAERESEWKRNVMLAIPFVPFRL